MFPLVSNYNHRNASLINNIYVVYLILINEEHCPKDQWPLHQALKFANTKMLLLF